MFAINCCRKRKWKHRLKDVKVVVDDAPIHLESLKLRRPITIVAGTSFYVEIVPADVFGPLLFPKSTNSIEHLEGNIQDWCDDEEITDIKFVKKESNIVIVGSVRLTKDWR